MGDGIPLSDIVAPNLIEIYKASSKQVHLKAISKASGVPLSEMMFLDKLRVGDVTDFHPPRPWHNYDYSAALTLGVRWCPFAVSEGTATWWRGSESQSSIHLMA